MLTQGLGRPKLWAILPLGIASHVVLSVPGSKTLLFAELYVAKCHSGSYGRSAGAGAEW